MCSDPESPNTSPSDGADCGEDTAACPQCEYWTQDHTTEVSRAMSDYAVSSQHPGFSNSFRFEAKLSSGEILITMIMEWGNLHADLTEAHKTAIKTAFKGEVVNGWSNKHSVKVTDPICGEKTLPIKFRVLWKPDDTTDSRNYRINATKVGQRSNVGPGYSNIDHDDDLDDNAWTLKHEFGHMMLLPDEYFLGGVTSATIDWQKADGTAETINLEPGSGVMQVRGDTTIHKRYLYFAAIEAQTLLRAKSGRDVICETV